MAIRSTNANRRGGTADDLARDMKASKGRDSSSSGSSRERIDYRDPALNGPFYPGTTRQEFRDDPNWRYQHTPGSDRGAHTGYKPSVSPKTPWVEPSAEWYAQDEAEQAQRRADEDAGWKKRGYAGSDWWKSDPEYQQLLASGNEKGAYRRKNALLSKAKDDIALKAFIAQGGTEETYRNRFNRDWPKPRSPLGAYSHGPGSADWDTRFTNPVPPNTIGGGRSGGGGRDMVDTAYRPGRDGPAGKSFLDLDTGFNRTSGRSGGAGGITGYEGPTEDMPPGMTLDIPSNNILSALRPLVGAPTSGGAAKKPTVVRRGGGRTDAR